MKFEHKINVYVINCKKHIKRLELFKKYANKAGLTFKKQECVNGSKFTDKIIMSMINKGILSKNSDITPIEVSINLSFMKVWSKIVSSKHEYGIILEDDIHISKDFVSYINDILTSVKDTNFDVIYLHNGNFASTKSSQKLILKTTINNLPILAETKGHNAGGPAYIISKKFAKYMLDKSSTIKYPHDMLMGYTEGRKLFTVKMSKNKSGCWEGPLLKMSCDGDYGTGDSTQNYKVETIKDIYKRLK